MSATAKGLFASICFALACVLIWVFWGSKHFSDQGLNPISYLDRLEKEGAPDFSLPDYSGQEKKLYTYKGKIIVLNFWATWCAPCVTEFPSMVKMAELLKDEVVLVTVVADERKQDAVDFVKTFKGNLPNIIHLYDPTTKVAESFGTKKLPETYIFNRDLRLVKKVVNSMDWSQPEVLTYLRAIK